MLLLHAEMRDKIIQKASDLFLNIGFKSVTMDDIANEMGISKKTIYAHFKNKTELVAEATLYVIDFINRGIDQIMAENNDPIEELYEIKKYLMLHLKNEQSSPQHQLQKYYPEIFESITELRINSMHDCTVKNLKRGIEQELYRENLDIDFVSKVYFIGVNGLKDESMFPNQQFPKAALMEEYLEYHLRGIVTKKGLMTLNKFINQNPTTN